MTRKSKAKFDDVLQQLLRRPGYEPWARACMSLLALTEGIDRYIESEEEEPHRDMRARVLEALSTNQEAKLLEIAGLHVFDYRAMGEETEELWQPLAESLTAFSERYGGKIRVWKEFSPNPPRSTIEDWLKQRVASNGEC